MKLTEVFICILIFVLSIATLLSTLTNINQKTVNIHSYEMKVNYVMKTDLRLRDEIRSISTCYWKNFNNEVKEKVLYLSSLQIDDVQIQSVKVIDDKVKKIQGIEIVWSYKNKEYVTREFIKIRLIDEKK